MPAAVAGTWRLRIEIRRMTGRLSRTAGRLLTIAMNNAGEAVYGAVMVGVLLAAENAPHVGYAATFEAAVIVLAIYLLTRLYTHSLGDRLRAREPLNAALVWHSCVHELPVLEGALIPVLALILAWAVGAPVTSGASAALWAAAASIVVLEVAAGWRSRGQHGFVLQAGAGATLGLALIALKLVLY
jgi:hypothetical protein